MIRVLETAELLVLNVRWLYCKVQRDVNVDSVCPPKGGWLLRQVN